jgi:hypothetical protein
MKKITASVITIVAFFVLAGVAQAHNDVVITHPVPDAGMTSSLIGIAVAGLAFVKRFVR